MADVRTFRAPTMQAALDVVRRELGSDAIILHTRQVAVARRWPWSRAKEEVEITAGLGVQVGPVVARAPAAQRDAAVSRKASSAGANVGRTHAGRVGSSAASGTASAVATLDSDDGPEFLYAPQAARSVTARSVGARPTSAPSPALRGESTAANIPSNTPSAPRNALAPVASLSTPAALRRPPAQRAAPATRPVAPAPPASVRPSAPRSPAAAPSRAGRGHADADRTVTSAESDRAPQVSERLDAIEKMLDDLGRTVRGQVARGVPEELVRLHATLIDQDVDDSIARDLLTKLQQKTPPEQWRDPVAAHTLLTGLIESELDCGETIVPARGRRVVAAMVGATGVGKTTTLAKLAANFRLRDKIRVGLVTVDTYRIAAVEQLRQYAEIIDLPMKVVTNPDEMRRALDELAGLDLVLIDTAGRSPRDDVQIDELNDLLDAADVDQAHLVLNITAGARHLEQTIDRFAAVEPNSIIVTKVDEAASFGSLLSVSRKLKCPISYVTTGQNVPDDIEHARPDRLARMIVQGSRVTS